MNGKKILSLSLALVFAGMLTACGQKVPMETLEPAETTLASTVPEETTEEISVTDFAALEALLGTQDSADALGGGEENWTQDHATFIGRIYQVSLLGQPVKVFTSCDNDKKVTSVSAWITDGSREVTEEEVLSWVQQVQAYTGSEPTFDGTSSEAGSQNWKWEKDGTFVTLRWLDDIVTIDMIPAVGELK